MLKIGLFANKGLILAATFVLALQFLLLHVPFMQYMFKTVPLSLNDWAVIVGVSAPIIIIEEVRKAIALRWYAGR